MKRRPAGSNSGDYQSAVAWSDCSSFHERLDVWKLFVLAYDQIEEFVEVVTTNLQSLHRIVRLSSCFKCLQAVSLDLRSSEEFVEVSVCFVTCFKSLTGFVLWTSKPTFFSWGADSWIRNNNYLLHLPYYDLKKCSQNVSLLMDVNRLCPKQQS